MQQPINTALLSYGMSGEVFHAPLIHAHNKFKLHSIVQRNSTKSHEHYPDVNVVRSVDEIFNNKDIELVIINTPNETHCDFAARALEAGKHVIVEKPFTVTSSEAEKLIALAHGKGKILTVFQNRRWDGDFLTVQQVIKNNLVGKVVEFEAHYDRYRNYIEDNTWKEQAKPGTGILYNLGSHMLDQMLVLFGKPTSIDARLGIQRPHGKVDDYYDIRMQYQDFQAIVKSSYLVREPGPRYILHGVEGSFIKYGLDPQEQALKEKKNPMIAGWGTESKEWWGKLNTSIEGLNFEGYLHTIPGNYLAFYDNVYGAIRKGESLIVKPDEAKAVIELIEASIKSNDLKQAVKIS